MKRFVNLFLAIFLSLYCYAQKNSSFEIRYNNDYTELNTEHKWLKGVQSFMFDYKDFKGEKISFSGLRYLAYTDDRGCPIIFDSLDDGLAFEYKVFDLEGDGKLELLVFFNAGGNAYILRIYQLLDDEKSFVKIVPWKTQPSASNQYSSIKVEKNSIIVATHNYEKGEGILEIKYKAKNGKLELLSEKAFQ